MVGCNLLHMPLGPKTIELRFGIARPIRWSPVVESVWAQERSRRFCDAGVEKALVIMESGKSGTCVWPTRMKRKRMVIARAPTHPMKWYFVSRKVYSLAQQN